MDALGLLLALVVTPADADERSQVGALAAQVQEATGEQVELAWVDQGYTGDEAAAAAAARGIQLEVVKLAEAKRGFVLLPRRWVVERSFAWMARFRRLARDYERLSFTYRDQVYSGRVVAHWERRGRWWDAQEHSHRLYHRVMTKDLQVFDLYFDIAKSPPFWIIEKEHD